MRIRDRKIRIRDPRWKKFGSGINIPGPQHWEVNENLVLTERMKCTVSGRYISVISSPAEKMVARLLVNRIPSPIHHLNLMLSNKSPGYPHQSITQTFFLATNHQDTLTNPSLKPFS
jgi:hypothetical protein